MLKGEKDSRNLIKRGRVKGTTLPVYSQRTCLCKKGDSLQGRGRGDQRNSACFNLVLRREREGPPLKYMGKEAQCSVQEGEWGVLRGKKVFRFLCFCWGA